MVLSEQGPALTLHDVLQDCDSLREERASDYLGQILSGLNAVHGADLVHRGTEVLLLVLVLAHDSLVGINAGCIGLAPRDTPSSSKLVKLGRVAYHTRLLDLHRSNSFGPHTPPVADEPQISDEWCVQAAPPGDSHLTPDFRLSRDVKNESSLLYTRQRDLHAVGIVLLQMLMSLNVTEIFPDVQGAIFARQSPCIYDTPNTNPSD